MIADKDAARKAAFLRRHAAHAEGHDAAAQDYLREALSPFRGKPIAGFLPIGTEIDPRPVIAEMTDFGPVGVPVTPEKGLPLSFREWTPDALLIDGGFGTQLPASGADVVPEVLIVPLVAFDRAGNRLGYGGGFYDRTLEGLRGVRRTIAIGFAYAAQETDAIPLEATDQPLDAIVTEAGILRL